jgi:quinol-cytochrome oxidoreductase complex cytochrome b subunit
MESAKPHPSPSPPTARIPQWYYYLIFPFFMIFGFTMRKVLGLVWANIFIAYGLIPFLDQVLSHDWLNPTFEQIHTL